MISWGSWILWGFVGTLVMTIIMVGSQAMRLTRMNFAYMLGTMFTPSREQARLVGMGVHMVNGLLFALLYAAIFEALGQANWWLGSIVGLGHAAFVLVVVMWLLPSCHPRMATEERGPDVTRQLEPPGFMGLNYGPRSPLFVALAHLAFGALFGSMYELNM